jgi:regulatory protein
VPRTATPVPADPEEARKAAHAAALRLLAGREMSAARVRDRLLVRGFPEDAVEQTVQRLAGAGVIDDRRAAQAAARTLVNVRHRGRHRVGRELERLGFSKELAQEATQSVLADADECAVLDKVVAAKLRGRRLIADPAAYRRLVGALLRRGFPADLIRTALRPYWGRQQEPEDQ